MSRVRTTIALPAFEDAGGVPSAIEKAIRDTPGVLHAIVNPATEMAYVEYDTDRCGEDALKRAIAATGASYPATPRAAPRPNGQARVMFLRLFIIGLVLTVLAAVVLLARSLVQVR